MLEPARVDLIAKRNGTLDTVMNIAIDGLPQSLTGYAFKLQVKAARDQGQPAIFTVQAAANGAGSKLTVSGFDLSLFVGNADLLLLTADQKYAYDLLVTAPGKAATPWVEGDFIAQGGVTT